MDNPFLEEARKGKNDFLRYLFSFISIIGFWLSCSFIIGLLGGLVGLLEANDFSTLESPESPMSVPAFIVIMLSYLPLLLATLLGVWLIHGRSPRTLINPLGRVRWSRVFQGFGIWLGLLLLASLVESLLYPGRYRLGFTPQWWQYLLPALVLIPLQTSTEEIFFRGYLLQAFGLKVRNVIGLVVLSGIVFAIPHSMNPEVDIHFWLAMASYFVVGAFAAWLTLKDAGLELALGMHASTNLFVLLVNYPNTALPIPSVFILRELDLGYSLISLLMVMVAFHWLVFRPRQNVAATPQEERIRESEKDVL